MDAKLAELFERVMTLSDKPSDVMTLVIDYENQHRKYLLRTYNGFIEYFEHTFDCIIKLNYSLNYLDKSHFLGQRTLQHLIYTENIGTLYSAFDRYKGGFYTDVMVLCRPVYESIIRIMFCSFYPESADSVVMDKPTKGKVKFILTNFMQDQLKVDWSSLYKLLCLHSHSNIIGSLQKYGKHIREGQKNPIAFSLGIQIDKIEICMNMMTFLLWNFIYIYKIFFLNPDNPGLEEGLLVNLNDTELLLSEILKDTSDMFKERHTEAVSIYTQLLDLEESQKKVVLDGE